MYRVSHISCPIGAYELEQLMDEFWDNLYRKEPQLRFRRIHDQRWCVCLLFLFICLIFAICKYQVIGPTLHIFNTDIGC